MSVLVTGGAGYIGSHMVRRLLDAGRTPVVIDNLRTGHRDAVPAGVEFLEADVADRRRVEPFLREQRVEAVLHFAALSQVGESVAQPRLYYQGNVVATALLLESVLEAGIGAFVLSSTAAVYGVPETAPIVEDHPARPINPYGATKLGIERMLDDYGQAYGLRHASLRYFNAAGAMADAGLGERHQPESHLIPLVLQAALGKRGAITIYGSNYPTADGTCVRDYIHVVDLADAHLLALDYLQKGGQSGVFNLGTGRGYSVREVIEVAQRVTGRTIPVVEGDRRPGDPPVLVASPRRAEVALGFRAERSSLERIVADAWTFHRGRGLRRSRRFNPLAPRGPEENDGRAS